jgi:hypothetical protein
MSDYLQAWSVWFSGEHTEHLRLWGISMLWWGRIGKFMEFFAACSILTEIIGPERLRAFGKSLHVTSQSAKERLKKMVQSFFSGPRHRTTTHTLHRKSRSKLSRFVGQHLLLCLGFLFTVWITIGLAKTPWSSFGGFSWGLLAYFFFTCMALTAGILIVAVIYIAAIPASILAVFIDSFLIVPFAWVLERQNIENIIRLGSVLLLLIGFHFDLLCS